MTVGVIVRPGKRGPETVLSEADFKSEFNLPTDYEEGTWTPGLTDGTNTDATFTSQSGNYTKIGNRVFIDGFVRPSNLGSLSGAIEVTGLPFTSGNAPIIAGIVTFGFCFDLNITASETVTGVIRGLDDQIQLRLWDSGTGESDFTAAELSADGALGFSACYFV